jgi:hypothetical protein
VSQLLKPDEDRPGPAHAPAPVLKEPLTATSLKAMQRERFKALHAECKQLHAQFSRLKAAPNRHTAVNYKFLIDIKARVAQLREMILYGGTRYWEPPAQNLVDGDPVYAKMIDAWRKTEEVWIRLHGRTACFPGQVFNVSVG